VSGARLNTVNSVQHPAADLVEGRSCQDHLYIFSDYVHLFKCMRNNLLNKREFTVSNEVLSSLSCECDLVLDCLMKLS